MKEQNKFNLERTINIIVVIAIVIVTFVIVKKHIFYSNEPTQRIEIGKNFSIPEINWNQNGKTILLVVTQDCSHCTASSPFLQQLTMEANKQNIKIEVISSDSKEDTKNYLTNLNLSIQSIHQLSLRKYGFIGTPTLLFVDQDGIVKDMWVGRISPENFQIVISKLNSFNLSQNYDHQASQITGSIENSLSAQNQIGPIELKASLENRNDVLVIDIDSREEFKNLHITKAKNIPNDEIQTRAIREIPKDKRIIFYGRCARDSGSRFSQKQLVKMGYSDVTFLAGGLKSWEDAGFAVEKSIETP